MWIVQIILFCLTFFQRGESSSNSTGTNFQYCPPGSVRECISLRDKCALLNKIIDFDTADCGLTCPNGRQPDIQARNCVSDGRIYGVDMTEYLDEILVLNRKLGFRDSRRYFQLQVKNYQKESESLTIQEEFKSISERSEKDKEITGEFLKLGSGFEMKAGYNIFGIKLGAGFGRHTNQISNQKSTSIDESSNQTRVAIERIKYVHYIRKFKINVALDVNGKSVAQRMSRLSPSELYEEIMGLKSTLTFFQPSPVSLVAGGVVTMDTVFRSEREMDFKSLLRKSKSQLDYKIKTNLDLNVPKIGSGSMDYTYAYDYYKEIEDVNIVRTSDEEVTVNREDKSRPAGCTDPYDLQMKLEEDYREWYIFPDPNSSGVTEVVPLWEIIKQAAEMDNDDDMRDAVTATRRFEESATILILGDTEPTILEALGQQDISGHIPFPFNLFLKDERFIVSYYSQDSILTLNILAMSPRQIIIVVKEDSVEKVIKYLEDFMMDIELGKITVLLESKDTRTRCKIESELGLTIYEYSASRLTKQVLVDLFMAGNVGGNRTYRAFLTDPQGTSCEDQWRSQAEQIRQAGSGLTFFSPTASELRVAAFLAGQNILAEVSKVKLHHLDLSQIPARDLTALLQTVDVLLDLRNVSNLVDILSDPPLVRVEHLYLSHQQFNAPDTEKLVRTMGNVGDVNIGRDGLVSMDLPTLESLLESLDDGRCERITFWSDTLLDITKQRTREMAQSLILKGWSIRENVQKLSISKQ